MAKTDAEIIADITSSIQTANSSADLSEGTVLRDIVESIASEISNVYSQLDSYNDIATLTNPDDIDGAVLDSVASNYGLTRLSATSSSGSVRFYSSTTASKTIPEGTVVSTVSTTTSQGISFSTSAAATLSGSSPIDSNTGMYYVDVDITSVNTGTTNNVGSNTITVISSAITGINSVTNPLAITSGSDVETNTELVARIVLSLQGSVLGTLNSYEKMFLANSNVSEAYVVDPNSDYAMRGPGSIDVYIHGEVNASSTEDVSGTSGETKIYFTSLPVSSITSVIDTNGQTYTEGTDYKLVQDTESVYAYSYKAKDYMEWLVTPPTVDYTITYVYNSLITTLQELEESADNHIITNDLLVKSDVAVLIDISMIIYKKSGYSSTTVSSNVVDALTAFIEDEKLGKQVRQSDIISLAEGADGVSYVEVPLLKLAKRGSSGVTDLILDYPYEYFTVDNNSFSITVGS